MTKTQKRQHDHHHHRVYWFDCLGGGVDGRAGGILVVVREDISFFPICWSSWSLNAIQGLLLGLLKGCAHCIAECVVYNGYDVILLRELIPHLKGSLFCIEFSSPGW
jgi:hypothetical protein